jgi:hypothetical protein
VRTDFALPALAAVLCGVSPALAIMVPAPPPRSPIPSGVWAITYTPNRATRTYTVKEDGSVLFVEAGTKGRLTRKGADLLLDFGDGKLERVTLARDGRLFVEHFNPKAAFPDGFPDQIGIGVRRGAR